jgi:hypothetical protein
MTWTVGLTLRVLTIFILLAIPLLGTWDEPGLIVPKLRDHVQPEIDRRLANAQKEIFKKLADADTVAALYKPALRQRAVKDPWGALTELEHRGLDITQLAKGGLKNLPHLVTQLDQLLERPRGQAVTIPTGQLTSLEEHVNYITAVLDAADKLREEALAKLNEQDRSFLFTHALSMVKTFSPQESLTDKTRAMLRDDRLFCTTWADRIDGVKFAASIKTLLQLTDPAYLDELKTALAKTTASPSTMPGIAGDVLLVRESRHGLIVFAGPGKNAYDLKQPVVFLADLGGDDSYRGTVAAGMDAKHPFSLVIDFAGNDMYEATDLGLATGRLGCGCLIDRQGDDVYKLAPGSGGCGFAGVGILVDEAGKDTYTGTRFTEGTAIAGSGLLLDLAGDDSYTSHGYSLGLGGPLGVGAVIDVTGDDRYQCGKHYGSGYNADDAPTAKPGDPNYQYDAFGAGIGLGRRLYPASPEGDSYHLAGGVGIWIDVAGNDQSETSNFSQACSYFFGIGLKMDLAGKDHHAAARYGLAAGAHYGMGLFLDYDGDDTYDCLGPVYNLGSSWDRSVFLLLDARGNDTYDLTKSSGGGRGDFGGWGILADLHGDDKYRLNGIPGGATDQGLAVFFDGAGRDAYPKTGPTGLPSNGKTAVEGKGYLFIDR